jgi:hypothetical protein
MEQQLENAISGSQEPQSFASHRGFLFCPSRSNETAGVHALPQERIGPMSLRFEVFSIRRG